MHFKENFFYENFLFFSDQAFKFCAMKNGDDCVRFKDSYHSNGAVIMDNHPLMIMAREEQRNLLRHPLCLSLGIIFEIQTSDTIGILKLIKGTNEIFF